MSATVHNIAEARLARNPQLECWLTTAELAAYLGFSTKWVTRRVAEGMPHARMGARLRFKISQVEPWLMNHS